MALHGPPWPSNYSKLTENTIGELSVKSQLTTHHYHKDDWNPEAKFGLSMALHGPPWPSNYSKLTENTIGELSVKSQLTTHHYHKDDWNPEAKFGLSMALKLLQID